MKKMMLSFVALLGVFAAMAQCNPQFTWTPAPTTAAPLQISFTNTTVLPTPSASAMPYCWISFGDGTTQNYFFGSTNHSYPALGTYNAKLVMYVYDSLTNQVLCSDSITQQVNVAIPPCYTTFNTVSLGGGSYTFTAAAPAGASPSYSWNFGDGSPVVTGNPVTHTFTMNGLRIVNLSTTAGGCTGIRTDSIMVTGAPSYICDSLNAYMAITTTGPLSISLQNTSNNLPGLTKVSQWYFGNGGSSTATNPSYTYSTFGTYNIMLVNQWKDSLTNVVICQDTAIQSHTIAATSMCDTLEAYIGVINAGPLTRTFQNQSSAILGLTNHAQWYFGDGNSSTLDNPTHTFPTTGVYTVTLINTWKDSLTQNVVCADSVSQQINLNGNPSGSNTISGYILWDSMGTVPLTDTFKVWLITFDSTTNLLTATDSTWAYGWGSFAPYTFGAQPAGTYLIKAASQTAVPGTTGLVPTYHTSSLYWNTATQVVHTGGATTGKYIWMQLGTVTSGPGFIAGNVNLGAGKGTTTGVPDLQIFLRNNNNQLVSMTYTDVNGDFKFEHVPVGTYTVYPEAINYATTPASVVIGEGQVSRTGVNFEKTESEIIPKNITGVKDIASFQDIKVYPNPFREQVTIDNQAGHYSQVAFITVTGQVIHKQQIKQGNNVISTSSLIPGVYFLLINGKEQTGRMTITKQ